MANPTIWRRRKSLESPNDFNQASFGRTGVFICDVNNPFYTSNLDNYPINTITNVAGDTWRVTYGSTPNLSEIIPGAIVHVSGATNTANNGDYVITAVNDGADTVDYVNANAVAQGAAQGIASIQGLPHATVARVVKAISIDAMAVRNTFGSDVAATTVTYADGAVFYGDISEVVLTAADTGILWLYFEATP